MFCPSCGAETREGLRYCNRCGANLTTEKVAPPRLFGIILAVVGAMVAIAVLALFLLFVFATETLARREASAEVYVFLMLFTLVIFGIEALLARQLTRLLTAYLQTSGNVPTEKAKLSQPQTTGQLTEAKYDTAQISAQTTMPIDAEQMTRKLETDK
jgi:predicted nucleic acid-binding Zn ribbon protein